MSAGLFQEKTPTPPLRLKTPTWRESTSADIPPHVHSEYKMADMPVFIGDYNTTLSTFFKVADALDLDISLKARKTNRRNGGKVTT
jgi:hypothetical protein